MFFMANTSPPLHLYTAKSLTTNLDGVGKGPGFINNKTTTTQKEKNHGSENQHHHVLTAKADLHRVGGNSCVIGQKTAEGVEEWIALGTLDMVEQS